ncbi:MAG: tryptophan 7-halogenase [Chthoniobacteraceae bacterium]
MIKQILVLGAGSAGLLAAISLQRKVPNVTVRIVRSPEIGVIGVGEGTTPNLPTLLFDYLGINRREFYARAAPTWKLGIHFLWGAHGSFDFTFVPQFDLQWADLPVPSGFYCDDDVRDASILAALMRQGKAFTRRPDGSPDFHSNYAFHIENQRFVETLEVLARELKIEIIDGKVASAERGPTGISAVVLEDQRRFEADLFIDASGFRSELLGKALGEPFVSFDRTLFCDRAVIGGWERTTEPILPYTIAEQMDSGWAWQIEHEHHVNRGYVYSSAFISDDEAAAEFRRKNPKTPSSPRIVKFRSGCYRRLWVENVVAIGNAGGFVEPLEATALMLVCAHTRDLIQCLQQSALAPTAAMRDIYNENAFEGWQDIRNFLSLHYKLNTALDTPFWQHCRAETDMSPVAPLLEFYAENGPTSFCRYRLPHPTGFYRLDGFLTMLIGNRTPYKARHAPTDAERRAWQSHRAHFAATARDGLDVRETLAWIRRPDWQ